MAGKMGGFEGELKARNAERLTERSAQKQALVDRQRAERAEALQKIEARRIEEAQARQARFPSGLLKPAWSWLSGEHARIKRGHEAEALQAKARDDAEKKALMQRLRAQRAFFVGQSAEESPKTPVRQDNPSIYPLSFCGRLHSV